MDIFVQNGKFLGYFRLEKGAEFVTSIDDAASRPLISSAATAGDSVALPVNQPVTGEDFESVWSFIAPNWR